MCFRSRAEEAKGAIHVLVSTGISRLLKGHYEGF